MQVKTHERILHIILGACITIGLVSVIAILVNYAKFSSAVTQTQYQEVIEIGANNEEIKPIVDKALADDKITGQEYDQIIRINNSIQRRRLLGR